MPDTFTPSGTRFNKTITASVDVFVVNNKQAQKDVSSVVDVLGVNVRQAQLDISASVDVLGVDNKLTQRDVSSVVDVTSIRLTTFLRMITATVDVSSVFTKLMNKNVAATLDVVVTDSTDVSKIRADAIRRDIDKILVRSEYAETVTLITETDTFDSSGGVIDTSFVNDGDVIVLIGDRPYSNRSFGRGEVTAGNLVMLTKWSYDLTGNGDFYGLDIGDRIIRSGDGHTYEIERILNKPYVDGRLVFVYFEIKRVSV